LESSIHLKVAGYAEENAIQLKLAAAAKAIKKAASGEAALFITFFYLGWVFRPL
jgi:hypothetical protein